MYIFTVILALYKYLPVFDKKEHYLDFNTTQHESQPFSAESFSRSADAVKGRRLFGGAEQPFFPGAADFVDHAVEKAVGGGDGENLPHPHGHSGLLHHPAAGGVFHGVLGGDRAVAHHVEGEIQHRPQGLGGVAPAPPGLPQAVPGLAAVRVLGAVGQADGADGDPQVLGHHGPFVKVLVAVLLGPAGQDPPGLRHVGVGSPGETAGDVGIAGPVAEHLLRVLGGKAAEDQAVGLQCDRSQMLQKRRLLCGRTDKIQISGGIFPQRAIGSRRILCYNSFRNPPERLFYYSTSGGEILRFLGKSGCL